MKKAGCNEPCPCGSGKKHKYCCFSDRKIPPLENLTAMLLDHEKKTAFYFTQDILLNQMRRESPRIAESFENLLPEELIKISKLHSEATTILFLGATKAQENKDNLQIVNSQIKSANILTLK